MFKSFLTLLLIVCVTIQAADVPPKPAVPAKPELRGILTEDDFTKLNELALKLAAARKVGDLNKACDHGTAFHAITKKLSLDPEGWTDAEYDAKVVALRRLVDVIKKSSSSMNDFHIMDDFYNATEVNVADAPDQQTFAKRWNIQSKLMDLPAGNSSWDGIRRKQVLDFMNDHPTLFPDIPTRVKFIDWLASVNIKTKVLNEIRADLTSGPLPPDDPKGKPQKKQK